MSKQSRTIVLTAAITVLAVVVLQNLRSVPLRIIVWQPNVPLFVLLLGAFLAGAVVAWYARRR